MSIEIKSNIENHQNILNIDPYLWTNIDINYDKDKSHQEYYVN